MTSVLLLPQRQPVLVAQQAAEVAPLPRASFALGSAWGEWPTLAPRPENPDSFARAVAAWREAEATHLSLNTMGAGLEAVDIATLSSAAAIVRA